MGHVRVLDSQDAFNIKVEVVEVGEVGDVLINLGRPAALGR